MSGHKLKQDLLPFRPKFWKPGSNFASNEDRTAEAENENAPAENFIYNPFLQMSLDQQRQRLPIFQSRSHIIYLLECYQTVVVVGETGCGKSTQLPQYLLEAGWTKDGKMVGLTQPRRVAATTLASRVSEERGAILGDEVGYCIRFEDCWTPQRTKIKFLTEGILIREMMSDPLLRQYSVLILDEVHERSIHSDILLGLMKKVLKKRPDLHLIVASATLDAEALRDFLNLNDTKFAKNDTATVMSITGRTFPIDIYYFKEPVANYVTATVETVMKIHENEAAGDVLAFLTGQEEVDNAVTMLIDYARGLSKHENTPFLKMLVVPMYSALTSSAQLKAFRTVPPTVRKVVVATNIAEASITIKRITYVIDCGFVKQRFFNSKTCTDCLVVVPVSQASAEQRAGRAGRERSGKAYRLYTEEEFDKLSSHSIPEIQRTSLSFAILQLKALGIDNILRFSFPAVSYLQLTFLSRVQMCWFSQAPPAQNVINALELLYALGALDESGQLTKPLGENMAEFPLHPMFSKMLLTSGEFGCTEEALIISAMLQVQCVFLNTSPQARKAHRQFCVEEGDMITLLNVYTAFHRFGKSKQWCQQNHLHYKGLLRAVEIYEQLSKFLKKFRVPKISSEGNVDVVRRCIAAAFFANAAYFHPSGLFRTIRGDYPLHIHPSSCLYTEQPPEWVVFGEVLHTSQEFMRDITVVDPQWLYELAPHYYQFGTVRDRYCKID
uniref:RNA helicase n=1 Tax=Strigamia maritima TaxID=126957 RepID=T1J1R0_STRMM